MWKRLLVVTLIVGCLGFATAPVQAGIEDADEPPVPGPIDEEVEDVEVPGFVELIDRFAWDIAALFPTIAEVAGWGALVGAVVNFLKLFGFVPDSWSARIALLSNVVLWVILWFAGALQREAEVRAVIEHLGTALPVLVSLATMLGLSKLAHWFMTKIDARSFSFSAGLMPLFNIPFLR